MIKTRYYDDFIRYFHLAKDQQEKCNVPNDIVIQKIDCLNNIFYF